MDLGYPRPRVVWGGGHSSSWGAGKGLAPGPQKASEVRVGRALVLPGLRQAFGLGSLRSQLILAGVCRARASARILVTFSH